MAGEASGATGFFLVVILSCYYMFVARGLDRHVLIHKDRKLRGLLAQFVSVTPSVHAAQYSRKRKRYGYASGCARNRGWCGRAERGAGAGRCWAACPGPGGA